MIYTERPKTAQDVAQKYVHNLTHKSELMELIVNYTNEEKNY